LRVTRLTITPTPDPSPVEVGYIRLRPHYHCPNSGKPEFGWEGSKKLRCLFFLLRRAESAGVLDLGDLGGLKAEYVLENFVGMFTQERRALHLGDRIRHLHRIANGEVFAAAWMIDLHHRAGLTQRRFLGNFLHRQNRSDRDVDLVADF